jgi:hypothetical protein
VIDEENELDEFRDSLADRRHAFGEGQRQVRLVGLVSSINLTRQESVSSSHRPRSRSASQCSSGSFQHPARRVRTVHPGYVCSTTKIDAFEAGSILKVVTVLG